jgi:hypothetical protein
MDISSETASLQNLSDQDRINRIKVRLAAIAADRESKLLGLEVTLLTEAELKGLPQNLPKAHYELLRQIGEFSLGYHGYAVIDSFTPRPWEESDYCTPIPEEYRMPEQDHYLYMARDVDGVCFGYKTNETPFELVMWDFYECQPTRAHVPSYLDLLEQHLFQEFVGTSLS